MPANGAACMTPETFFDYLEGRLAPDERADLERALIADPELQKQFVAAKEIHRALDRSPVLMSGRTGFNTTWAPAAPQHRDPPHTLRRPCFE